MKTKTERFFRISKAVLCVSLICAAIMLCGCTNSYIDTDIASEISERGNAILEDFLASEFPGGGYSVKRVGMMTGAEEDNIIWAGYYLSNVVECNFEVNGKTYAAAVDLEDGTIYTDYGMFDLNTAVADQLRPYCERYGYFGDISVSEVSLYRKIISHDMPSTKKRNETVNTQVFIDNTIPAEYLQLEREELIEKVLSDADISGFDVSFEVTDGSCLDPRALTDYLEETGNYVKPENERYNDRSYRLHGSNRSEQADGALPEIWSGSVEFDGPENASFSLTHTETEKIREFYIRYTSGYRKGAAAEYEETEIREYDCPVQIEDNTISFYGGNEAQLYFSEKPPYTSFTRILYDKGAAMDPEELVLEKKDNGTWSLNRKKDPFVKSLWYFFDQEQDIKYK